MLPPRAPSPLPHTARTTPDRARRGHPCHAAPVAGVPLLIASALAGILLLSATPLAAQSPAGIGTPRPTDRRFAYLDETLHGAATGRHEVEQWLTYGGRSDADPDRWRLDGKTEFEYGLAEHVHVGVEFEYHTEDSASEHATLLDATGAEVKFRLADPRTDLFGLALKTEVEFGHAESEWKNRLVVDKTVGRWQCAYNLTLEAAWEGDHAFDFGDCSGELVQALGVSLELDPTTYVGAELLWEEPLPDWDTGAEQNVFLGPNLALHGANWSLTATPLLLLTGADDEPDFQLRLLFEVGF